MSALVDDDGESSNSELVDLAEEEAAAKKEEQKNERAKILGFQPQKEIVYNKILPYSGDKVDLIL